MPPLSDGSDRMRMRNKKHLPLRTSVHISDILNFRNFQLYSLIQHNTKVGNLSNFFSSGVKKWFRTYLSQRNASLFIYRMRMERVE